MSERAIPSAESTDYPVWIIVTMRANGDMLYHAGPWFSRQAAQDYLTSKSYNYPKKAVVYCASGHMSWDYRNLCESGKVPHA